MALILNIETATPVCSVSLAENDHVISLRESSAEKSHAENLIVFIDEILNEQQLTVSGLDAIAVGKGPGSYTGLRIGVSTAKGLAYGAKIPLLAVSTLETMVEHALMTIDRDNLPLPLDENTLLCPMIDARRMEVYMALFDHKGNRIQQDAAMIVDPDAFAMVSQSQTLVSFGSGAAKCQKLIKAENKRFLDGIYPSALAMSSRSYQLFRNNSFEDIAYFEPYYLKDFMTTTPRKNLLQHPTK
ncbi:MAG: tRNA (adenosine(37)-N6)-threonylcarbamoyltransferase complex dimerization subunit type 1 TsaB [Bacteroidales bacterium]|nr:tRNA (adenosine(37)-N6)-threonylcarbamoyltransferase complex dimerization subunit type 1 TsaB [Bacteroidales bacterium]MBN2764446.1 tRNA (adenosine(37)-N6)-threonylcarbamoyltransferase complex dimerization subunit type 1 TsaB [Bacteroidales bacterium]